MASKNLNARIVSKHDTEANWLLAPDFIPLNGEIVVYDIDDNHATQRLKIGDGVSTVGNLPFISDEVATEDDIWTLMSEMDMMPVVTDESGAILTDENNNILLI